MFRIWIGNLGKYNEGELIGEWVDLPCDDFDGVFERIGINERYEEWFIADYENDYGIEVGEYENIDSLNELAERLEDVDEEIFGALSSNFSNTGEALDIYESGNWRYYQGVHTMGELVEREFEETGRLAEIERVIESYYIDWDSIGRDWEMNGNFISTDDGYVEYWY